MSSYYEMRLAMGPETGEGTGTGEVCISFSEEIIMFENEFGAEETAKLARSIGAAPQAVGLWKQDQNLPTPSAQQTIREHMDALRGLEDGGRA